MNLNKKTLSFTIACLLGTSALQANAAIIDLQIDAQGTASAYGSSPLTNTDSGTTDVSVYTSVNGEVASAYSSASGESDGSFYSSSASYDYASATSSVKQTYTVTNDTSEDQFFDFSFDVVAGSLESMCGNSSDDNPYGINENGYGSDTCEDTGFASASYMAEILFNGLSVWDSAVSMSLDSTGLTYVTSGTELSPVDTDSNTYYWSDSSFNIDLGLVAAGSDFTVEYILTTQAESFTSEEFNIYTQGRAQFGDPSGFGTTNVSFDTTAATTPTSVPVPATLALLGLGLVGFRISKRKAQ
ncbi:PEP-CTERM sorting domain-containing protein [Pseudocolwellia sp. HL-MZ19]|uniref:PEP-CTERM sorting domain-containing protein n=1 Tax=unclassified Pseudocolwellia TaxID=2848178 RepID=UPI003CEA5912